MQTNNVLKIPIDTAKCVLSSTTRVHKTERFLRETRHISAADVFTSKIAEGIILKLSELSALGKASSSVCFVAETDNREHTFLFRLGGKSAENTVGDKDLIFYRYVGIIKERRRNDQRFLGFIKEHQTFELSVRATADTAAENDFLKLYSLSNSDRVNFPLLNEEQLKIVMLENQNVLVQGVAGSGKTNICIDKIVYSACREYAGRVLYTTYSRGLLLDTASRVDAFKQNIKAFIADYTNGSVIFADTHHKKAIENRLGIWFSVDDDEQIIAKLKRIISFLDNKVDYFLIEDLYASHFGNDKKAVGESYFLKNYVKNPKNIHLAGNLERIKHISPELIYKEIFGMIFGCYDLSAPSDMLTLAQYIDARKDSFTKTECEIIYSIATDYSRFMEKNDCEDNNSLSRKLLADISAVKKYSLVVVDETQDFTELNLCLLKSVALKLFCVGDALQMINPSYFGFAYLKRLMYDKELTSVAELKHNYRNTRRIEQIIEELGSLNVKQFGTHSFVLKGECVDSAVPTSAVYVSESGFIEALAKENYDNFTVIVGSTRRKEELRKLLKKQEILTVSEVKGLERDVVILLDVLSDNAEKWNELARSAINRKRADENSVYRYYFNLLYVGVSRARQHLYVAERKNIAFFEEFFEQNFDYRTRSEAIGQLNGILSRIETDDEETLERVRQFTDLEQYENARFAADKITDDAEREAQLKRISVYEEFVHSGRYREAGIRFWELGMLEDAKFQFTVSGDERLADLLEAATKGENSTLDIDILQFYPDLEENLAARKLIIEVLQKDLKQLTAAQRALNKKLKENKEKK